MSASITSKSAIFKRRGAELYVLFHVHFTEIRFPTGRAGGTRVFSDPLMTFHVIFVMVRAIETFATFGAIVSLSAAMSQIMLIESAHVPEGLVTLITFHPLGSFFWIMDVRVQFQIALCFELFTTNITSVVAFRVVSLFVGFLVRLSSEGLVANGASKGVGKGIFQMPACMVSQKYSRSINLATGETRE